MTIVRRPKGFPTIAAAVTVWIGVMVLAPAGAAALTMETLQKFTFLGGVSDRLIQGRDGKFYGTTPSGGAASGGTVFRLNPDGTALEVLHSFACDSGDSGGCSPSVGLTAGSDGKFYGTTATGGVSAASGGTVFRLNPDGTAFEVVHAFTCQSGGCSPSGGLTAGRDGKFYGTTVGGGAAGGGTVFRLNPDGTAFEVLHTFACDSGGCFPSAGLTASSDGKFYGTTAGAGARIGGTVFRLNPDGTAFEVLYAFDCRSDGCRPEARLTVGSDGKFYGTTAGVGAAFGGTVFRLNPDGTAFEVLHAFECENDGCSPSAGLTAGRDGKFYGTTRDGGAAGGGTVFRFNPDGTAFEVLHSFACESDGCVLSAGLTAGSDGKFFGTTRDGGAAGGGVIFAVETSGSVSVVTPLGCLPTCFPSAGLTAGRDGKFYGTTRGGGSGGAAGGGTVFRLNPDGTAFEVLHAFACDSDGCNPFASLTAGNDGKFYGTTRGGGAAGGGTVFRLNPDGTAFEVLHSFACESDGCRPEAGLTAGRDGKFYGTTPGGGVAFAGTVFRLNPDGTAFEVLHAFACGSDGCRPEAGLTAGRDGKFYGTTGIGGPAIGGTVFRLNPNGTAFEVLHAFACDSDGCFFPFAGLTAGSDGKFYGTTSKTRFFGPAIGGTVFRLNPDGTAFEVLHSFDCRSDGCGGAGLTVGNDGKFYGTTPSGGAAGGGTVFRVNPDGTAFEVLHAFGCDSGGCSPSAGLTAGRDGNFYGTTERGGDGGGTVFRFAPGSVTRFTGTATGVGLSGNRAGMQIVGRFTSQTNINLGAATVTITGLLDEKGGNRELVRGLPLTLSSMPGSGPDLARFEDRTRPNFAFFDIRDLGRGEFDFRIKLGAAAIASPALCSPTRLTTRFRLDDGLTALVVSTEQPWSCFGPGNKYLKTP